MPKYRLSILASTRHTDRSMIYWEDLDGDGISEKINMMNYKTGYAAIAVYFNAPRKPKEWDIPGELVNLFGNEFFTIGEPIAGKGKSLFVFTKSKDSIFLNRISEWSDPKSSWDQTFVTTVGIVNGSDDANIVSPRLEDLENDGDRELVFGINTGLSITPRAVFVYDPTRDTLLRSIETGNNLINLLVTDFNGDHQKEIIVMGYAPENIKDTVVTYHDSSNWVMIFDHTLRLMFSPLEYPGYTGGTFAMGIDNPVGFQDLYVLWVPPATKNQELQLIRIATTGLPTTVKRFTEFARDQSASSGIHMKMEDGYKFVFPLVNGDVYIYDTSFSRFSVKHLNQPISYMQQMDVDLDGKAEMLVFDFVLNTMTVFREGFDSPASVTVEMAGMNSMVFSLKKQKKNPLQISIFSGNLSYLLLYRFNPFWYARWGVWLAIWLAVFLFTLLIRKTTHLQLEKRLKTEKKITELQLAIVRNQMDPHFTMNAINAVIDAVNREEKEEARENLLHFSKMYRSLVLSADKIKRPLCEEIEFTENYLALEQFRFRDRFSYVIDVQSGVDLATEVPKMVIQSPVENAVKHGLLRRSSPGEVKIAIRREDKALVIEVTDNGVGRAATAEMRSGSTGKGMGMMDQFFELYHRVTGVKVQSMVEDLKDEEGNPAGTKIIIQILNY